MHVYKVTPGIYKIFSYIASLKTYRHGYFRKQQNETGYFYGKTLSNNDYIVSFNHYFVHFIVIQVIMNSQDNM